MSDRVSGRQTHILQARHNEELAKELVSDGYRFKDWSIVAAFYAAMHYFEARLHDNPPFTHPEAGSRIIHAEDSVPRANGRSRYAVHGWRGRLLRSNCDRRTWNAYRALRSASETARYHSGRVIPLTAHDHFSDRDVDLHVVTYLGQVKLGLGVS